VLDEVTTRRLIGVGLAGAALVGLAVAAHWRWTYRQFSLFPLPRRKRLVPWMGWEVALAMLLWVMIPSLVLAALMGLGVLPLPANPSEPTLQEKYRNSWALAATPPLTVGCILGMMWFVSRTRPKHLGITRWRWRPALALAYISYIVVTPIVMGLQLLATKAMELIDGPSQPHLFQQFVETINSPSVWVLVVMYAVVIAPILEELIFRGIMLPWLAERRWGGWAAMAAAIAIGASELVSSIANRQAWNWAPLAFALGASAIGALLTWPRAGEQWARRAIIGTGLLFAMFHITAWPSPIPLLVLGMALGWVMHRTRSLVAPIALHALFNATSTMILLIGRSE